MADPQTLTRCSACRAFSGYVRVAAALSLLVSCGCYDSKALTQAKLEQAERMRLEDVDLGQFRITLPKRPNGPLGAVIEFHAFGQVANRDRKAVEKQLKQDDARLRNRMLVAVRNLTYADLEEPGLSSLREDVAQVLNETLPNSPVKGIGFYEIRFSTL